MERSCIILFLSLLHLHSILNLFQTNSRKLLSTLQKTLLKHLVSGDVVCCLALELLPTLPLTSDKVNVCNQLMPRGTPHFTRASHVSLESETGFWRFTKDHKHHHHETKPWGYYLPVPPINTLKRHKLTIICKNTHLEKF